MGTKHIVIDARIRRTSTGRPVAKLLEYLPLFDKENDYTVLLESDDPVELKAKNMRIVRSDFKQFSMNPLDQIKFAKQIRDLKPDLVYFGMTAQAPLPYTGKSVTFTHDLTMLRYARAGRLPELVHKLRMVGYRKLFRQGNLRASAIITPTNFVKNDLNNYLPQVKDKIHVVYEAMDDLSHKSVKNKNVMVNGPFIFHVGAALPHKNLYRLVKAFEKLKPDFPDLQLVLAGRKEYYFTELEAWVKDRKYAKDINIPGFVTDAEMQWLHENAQAYVLPSLSEGASLPGLEAMAYNLPLVSSNYTCLPEMYGKAAEYFDPKNVDDMASAIKKALIDQKLRQKLIKEGHEQLKKFSWKKSAEETVKIIKENL